ncbi:hypothetical protein [Nitrosopumilus sp.]|uniref:hypothetical protein n=1 Tax=Nitrosopumilus sp. TaxID=2024843 RepID=UPI00261AC2B2|nr:hypothetical protein [Nitrosopumilus sp.]
MYQRLIERVGSTGKVIEDYGGYEIIVTDNKEFPWFDVFNLLVENGFQIWIVKENDHLQIMSKPEVN